jgi:hypothetical protein
LRNSNEQMLALIPRVPGGATSHAGVKREGDDTTSVSASASAANVLHDLSKGRKKRKTQNAPAPVPASDASQSLPKSDRKRIARRAQRARRAAQRAQERETQKAQAQKAQAQKTEAITCTNVTQTQSASVRANLIPLANRRLPEVEVPEPKVEKRWPFSPKALEAHLARLQSRTERLQGMFPPMTILSF